MTDTTEDMVTEVSTVASAPHRTPTPELHATYTTFEILVALVAVVGNAMVIYVFHRERRLRRRTNYYIVSLAVADFLVGLLGIPFAILASVGQPRNLHACLFTVSLLVMLCTISIFCLVGVSVDRYWAILHPMCYSRNVRTRTAISNSFKHFRRNKQCCFVIFTLKPIDPNQQMDHKEKNKENTSYGDLIRPGFMVRRL
ncbi:hypothetical protein PYW08_003971 [Mythimna loreyi]|uniref:Uncharacterized protein n=1 Tax=Mythimna loreyi TaxID=667449 RepID=A0ACC2QWT2_9NEOP|nr:hypothetical protein PYW08_003971 [Mythimna loreyi]